MKEKETLVFSKKEMNKKIEELRNLAQALW